MQFKVKCIPSTNMHWVPVICKLQGLQMQKIIFCNQTLDYCSSKLCLYHLRYDQQHKTQEELFSVPVKKLCRIFKITLDIKKINTNLEKSLAEEKQRKKKYHCMGLIRTYLIHKQAQQVFAYQYIPITDILLLTIHFFVLSINVPTSPHLKCRLLERANIS